MRLGSIFVAVCMVLIAGSAGATAYLGFGLAPVEAAVIALAILTSLALHNAIATRTRVRAVVGGQVSDLSRTNSDLAQQIIELGRRIAGIEERLETVQTRARAAINPLALELDELGTLVKQLADSVASHETRIGEIARTGPLPVPVVGPAVTAAPVSPLSNPGPAPVVAADATASPVAPAAPESPPSVMAADDPLAVIRAAIEAPRVDLYLQPIVTLPQRKVRYYEGLSRLRTETGDVLQAADFVPLAERAGLMARVDNLVVLRCVQIVRRLMLKNRDIGVFCNICAATLTDAVMFQQLLEFLDANRAIAASIILEVSQALLRTAGPIENESLSALADHGFRFSLDNLTDLRIEPRDLANRGFRFVKVPAELLLSPNDRAADIHPADLSDLLGRYGVDLIAEKIENEAVVVNLLDCDVRYGQGFLFSQPRPVRAEALHGVADRGDLAGREPGSRDEPQLGHLAAPAPIGSGRGVTSGLAQLARPAARI